MDIELVRHPDSEGNDNRGFSVDALELLVDGNPAGYLKICHIPFHRILQWDGIDAANAALEFQSAARRMKVDEFLESGERTGLDPLVSHKKLNNLWWNLEGRGNLHGGGSVAYHVDRPYVDYIRVYEPGDHVREIPPFRFRNSRPEANVTENYRKSGLGTLLYVEGARWMAERNMLFHASGTRSNEAVAAWETLQKHFPEAVRNIPKLPLRGDESKAFRTVLDGSLLPPWYPRGASVTVRENAPGRPPEMNNIEDLTDERVVTSFAENDSELRLRGIEPLGGEYYPSSPLEAIRMYEEQNLKARIR